MTKAARTGGPGVPVGASAGQPRAVPVAVRPWSSSGAERD